MAANDRDVLAFPPDSSDGAFVGTRPGRIIPLIPIGIALFGVGLILFGGIRATEPRVGAAVAVDPVVTGTIAAPRDLRRDLEMLDR